MSFILDALRKSEHERQRQTGPALVESAVAPPRPRSNVWATVAIVLLVVNIVAIGVLLLMRSGGEPEAGAPPATAASEPTAVQSVAPAAASPAQVSVTQTAPEPRLIAPPPPPPAAQRAPLRGNRNPLEDEMGGNAPAAAPETAVAAAQPPPGPAAVRATRPGTVVYQTLPEADLAAGYAPPPASPAPSLPTADEIVARGGLPDLRLELHVYSNRPQDRFVFLNGRRYREGDTTAEGATIVEITRDGVVMSAGGNRFLLPRD